MDHDRCPPILIYGLCPLPFENTRKSFGPGIRTWQFAHSLQQAGLPVHLLTMCIPGTYEGTEPVRRETRDGMVIERLDQEEFFDLDALAKVVEAIQPAALVGATMYGSSQLAKLDSDLPLWADQFGHVMAEAQAKAHLEGANWPLAYFWEVLEPILRRADRLSVVSEPQRYAAIGELGLAGRLSHQTCGYEFTATIPCALVPREQPDTRPVLRGSAYPEDAFVVFWSGGYNVWSDVDTLFHALEKAMDEEPSIQFVSTGGEIGGHDETTYRRFEEAIAASPHSERYHLEGWVDAELVPSYETEADLGVLSEIPIYEGMLGSKNRIVQWMGNGLPVLYNRVGDLGRLLESEGLGRTFAVGDVEGLAEQLVWAAHHRQELTELAQRAQRYTRENLSFEATTRELVAWARDPRPAPDAELRGSIRSLADYAPAPEPPEVQEIAEVQEPSSDNPESPVEPEEATVAPEAKEPVPSLLGRLRRRLVG